MQRPLGDVEYVARPVIQRPLGDVGLEAKERMS